MNKGVLQSSIMQQMMGSENPSFHFPNSSLPFSTNLYYDIAQDQLPESWSQLLLSGLIGEDDQKSCMGMFQAKKLENWEELVILNSNYNNNTQHQQEAQDDVKKENSVHARSCTDVYGHDRGDEYRSLARNQNLSPMIRASSPQSCLTSFSSNMLDFSNNNNSPPRHPPPDRSFECNSNAAGGAMKKARVQSSSNQTTIKVRKEKLGDRITALHQLVSPFGKTDTASVLLEVIGYIRFLHTQIEALGLTYLDNTSGSTRQQQHSVEGEINCVFPQDSGQDEEPKKDLRSRGLCLVPVSCTLQVGSDNGADYWGPAFGGGGYR